MSESLLPQAKSRKGRRTPKWWCAALCALILTSIVPASLATGDGRHVDAVTVFHCGFGDDWDVNYDSWPDRWVRRSDVDHPHYVNIAIQSDPTAVNDRCLRIDLDGAAAAVSSPPIRVLPRFSYVFEAKLKIESIKHSVVFISLDFCDSNGRVLQTRRSKPIATTAGWAPVTFDPIEPSDPAIDRVIVGLHVERRMKGDLEGRVSLADVRLARLPRIAVSTNNPANVYTELHGVVVRCELSGIPERDPEIRFQLLDASNHELQSDRYQLKGQPIVDDSRRDSKLTDGVDQGLNCYEASTEWQPKIADYGHYRVVVRMLSTDGADDANEPERLLASRTIYLAVVPPLPMPRRGEFGWTLPDGEGPLSFQDLSRLLPKVGINWVKVPVWFDANDSRRGDELIRFVELLGASNIEVVGILDRPPASSEFAARLPRNTPVADVLTLDTSTWSASLEPVMTRLSLRVRWWQLGRDFDTSFVGFPALNARIETLRKILFRFGQDVRLGLSWDWTSDDTRAESSVTWDFQQLCCEEPTTEQEFDTLLAKPRENAALRWVFVDPPAEGTSNETADSAREERASELVRRMVAAKVHGADAIIIRNPFNDENGLMRASGMPAELLLPWRTTAAMLAGAEYLGQMQLPAGSENRIFLRPDGQVVMVVWNREPVRESLYLGEDVRQFDLLGGTTTPEQQGQEQVLRVGHAPMFVLGLHEAITRWRMSATFENLQVPSVFKTPHPNSLRFRNYFPQGVGGSLKIVVDEEREENEDAGDDANAAEGAAFTLDRWTIEPPHANFQIAAGQAAQVPFEIRLKNALFGKQPIRIDFTVEAEKKFEFSVYREMEVGTADLTLQVNTQLEKDGTLIIEQLMTNRADRLADLKCYLYAKGRRPERMQVYRLGPNTDRKVYRFPDGAELVGKEMLLEIEELNGPRVLLYRFVATATPDASEPADDGSPPAEVASAHQTATDDRQRSDVRR